MTRTTTTGDSAHGPGHTQEATAASSPTSLTAAGHAATLSQALWGEDFLDHLPYAPPGTTGVEVVRGDWNRVASFLAGFPELRETPGSFGATPRMTSAKLRYLGTYSDLMECRRSGQTVGLFIGAPEDWSTYYCRVLVIDPDLAVRPLLRRFARECLEKPLARLGVERLTGETNATNSTMARWFLELGFQVTGQRLTDRWGPLTRFTKFLNTDCSRRFAQRFGPQRE